jgi:uncharacterized protein (TIGR03086 family)
MADVKGWLRDAADGFGTVLDGVGDDQWPARTPNAEWDVRALVAHLVDEQLWAPPLLAGRTIEDIGDEIPDDPLGDDPKGRYRAAARRMVDALAELDLDTTVHLSFGDVPAQEYLMQLFADHLIHRWDLARATGQDERLDPELVQACATWFAGREDLYREGQVIGPAVSTDGRSPQDDLLGRFGRDPT